MRQSDLRQAKRAILAAEQRQGKRLEDLRGEFNHAVLSGGRVGSLLRKAAKASATAAWQGHQYGAKTAVNVTTAPIRAAVNKARWGYVGGKPAYDDDVRKHYRARLIEHYQATHDAITKAYQESRQFMKILEQDKWWHQKQVKY